MQITNDVEYRIRNQESGIKNPNLKLSLILKQSGLAICCWNLECRIQKRYSNNRTPITNAIFIQFPKTSNQMKRITINEITNF